MAISTKGWRSIHHGGRSFRWRVYDRAGKIEVVVMGESAFESGGSAQRLSFVLVSETIRHPHRRQRTAVTPSLVRRALELASGEFSGESGRENVALDLSELKAHARHDFGGVTTIEPFIEAPWFEGAPAWPWPVANYDGYESISLSANLTLLEMGTIAAQLVDYNRMDLEVDAAATLDALAEADRVAAPGGLVVKTGSGFDIAPGCCCGIETWRGWQSFLKTGTSPWLGHDPAPLLERVSEDRVLLWPDGALSTKTGTPLEFTVEQLREELARAERDLEGFARAFRDWLRGQGCRAVDEIDRAVRTMLELRPETA